MWIKNAFVIFVVLSISGSALGQDFSARRSAAREALAAMHYADTARTSLNTTLTTSLDTQMKAHPEQQQLLSALLPTMKSLMEQRLPEFIDTMTDIYATEFTAAELVTITAFYQTTAGQKLTVGNEELKNRTRLASQAWSRNVLRDLYEKMGQALRAPSVRPGGP